MHERARAVPKAAPVADAGATEMMRRLSSARPCLRVLGVGVLAALGVVAARAAILPEERSDALYHMYTGDEVTVQGPSFLVRKSVGSNVSVSANYYIDFVTSASVDVRATASEYDERRDEQSLSLDFLQDKSIITAAYTRSDESDYTANTATFGISQDFFGDQTTLSMSYSRGWDTVRNNADADFEESLDRQTYRLGVTQILSRNALVTFNFEAITDEGFLNNPYRSVRFLDPTSGTGFSYQQERYPETRTSGAGSMRGKYFLPWGASASLGYRYFEDTWGITAHTGELAYAHAIGDDWTIEASYRYYTQTGADFYSDLFPRRDAQNFLARDKELSTFASHQAGIGITYEFFKRQQGTFKRSSVTLLVDQMRFDYDDFRDATDTGKPVGEEDLFGFNATVVQLFFSLWY
jgi:hypothetical protein